MYVLIFVLYARAIISGAFKYFKGAVPLEPVVIKAACDLIYSPRTDAHNLNTYQLTVADYLPQRAFTSKDYQYCRAEAVV